MDIKKFLENESEFSDLGIVNEKQLNSERELESWSESIKDTLAFFGSVMIRDTEYDPGAVWTQGREFIGSIDLVVESDGDSFDVQVVFLMNEVDVTIENGKKPVEQTFDYNQFSEDKVYDLVLEFLN